MATSGSTKSQRTTGRSFPSSTYGASKLAGEALICSYTHMFGLSAAAFRFANVVGPRQTHGVGFDFLRRLLDDPTRLPILGDGKQSKSYIHVDDVVRAVLTVCSMDADRFAAFNVATGDYITVREIADLAVEVLGLDPRRSASTTAAVTEVGRETSPWSASAPGASNRPAGGADELSPSAGGSDARHAGRRPRRPALVRPCRPRRSSTGMGY